MAKFKVVEFSEMLIHSECKVSFNLEDLVDMSNGLSIIIANAMPQIASNGISDNSQSYDLSAVLNFKADLDRFCMETLCSNNNKINE